MPPTTRPRDSAGDSDSDSAVSKDPAVCRDQRAHSRADSILALCRQRGRNLISRLAVA